MGTSAARRAVLGLAGDSANVNDCWVVLFPTAGEFLLRQSLTLLLARTSPWDLPRACAAGTAAACAAGWPAPRGAESPWVCKAESARARLRTTLVSTSRNAAVPPPPPHRAQRCAKEAACDSMCSAGSSTRGAQTDVQVATHRHPAKRAENAPDAPRACTPACHFKPLYVINKSRPQRTVSAAPREERAGLPRQYVGPASPRPGAYAREEASALRCALHCRSSRLSCSHASLLASGVCTEPRSSIIRLASVFARLSRA